MIDRARHPAMRRGGARPVGPEQLRRGYVGAPGDRSARGPDPIGRPARTGDGPQAVRGVRATRSAAPSRSILEQVVGAAPSVEDVLPRPADERVVAVAADERVVAVAAA